MEETTSGETSTERSDSHLSSFNISDIENGSASDLERQIVFGAPQALEEIKSAAPNPKKSRDTSFSDIAGSGPVYSL
ncbi:hypothetical protein SUGI_0787590 [Cryptomeria japonica]|nr:hypothetical protein SUGI_0787590 [Cryptomeria japonica]